MSFLRRLVLVLWVAAIGAAGVGAGESLSPLVIETADGARHRFMVERAADPDSRARGLMHRRTLPLESGMLFDYGTPRTVSMWMKNTFLPLDMLFLDDTGRIISMAERTPPHSLDPIGPQAPVRAVLEINAGLVFRLGLRPGGPGAPRDFRARERLPGDDQVGGRPRFPPTPLMPIPIRRTGNGSTRQAPLPP
ncbi:MAG: hypothetical protein FD149_1037 [Rhodospirillaceae bacterium]|nr:MAG: hypothetical protein FD149_1037 [Rhodospirillaceae bacterium]